MDKDDVKQFIKFIITIIVGTIVVIAFFGAILLIINPMLPQPQEIYEHAHIETIEAEAVGIDKLLESVDRGTSTRFQVVAQAEIGGELHIFYSERVRFNPIHQYPAGSIIEVSVNLDNPSSYQFRLS